MHTVMNSKKKPSKYYWFGVRSVFLFGKKKNGSNVFEERIVVFSAKTSEEAFAKAQREAESYAKILKLERHPDMEAYIQDGDNLIDGYEVWSTPYESRENLKAFVKNRYDKYRYHPDK